MYIPKNEYANKSNCCVWSKNNPQVYNKSSLHSIKLSLLCISTCRKSNVWHELYGLMDRPVASTYRWCPVHQIQAKRS